MAHVNITKDLTEVKSKVVFGLTQRQLIFLHWLRWWLFLLTF